MDQDWRLALRRARRGAGFSMETVAQRSELSYETIRGYENGRRSPTRDSLLRVVRVLGLTAADANALLVGAGFAPEATLYPPDEFPAYAYELHELQRVVDGRKWPAFATNEALRVVAANRAVQTLWGFDYAKEKRRKDAEALNLFAVARACRFRDRILNLDQFIGQLAAASKGRPRRDGTQALPPGIEATIEALKREDPALSQHLGKVWKKAKPAPTRVQIDVPIVWLDADFGEMRFQSVISLASESDGLKLRDWHPADAETWLALEKVAARGRRHATKQG